MSLSRIAQTELEQKLKVEYPSENNTKFPYVNTLYLYSSNKQVSQKWTVFFNYKWLKSIKSQTGEYSSETATFRKKTAVFNSGSVLVFFRNSPSTSISTVKTQSKQHSMVHSMACTWPAHGLHMACSVCKHCKLGESSSSNPFSKSKKPLCLLTQENSQTVAGGQSNTCTHRGWQELQKSTKCTLFVTFHSQKKFTQCKKTREMWIDIHIVHSSNKSIN